MKVLRSSRKGQYEGIGGVRPSTRRADHRRHEPGFWKRLSGKSVPGGPLLPHQRDPDYLQPLGEGSGRGHPGNFFLRSQHAEQKA